MKRRRFRCTVRLMMVVLACLAVGLALIRKLREIDPFFGTGTFYAPGYEERLFNQLRVGMSAAEVEAIIGSPLRKISWNQHMGPHHEELWTYSDRPDVTFNYWRRWVIFENGKIVNVINDFWFD
jgi:hypothetical protein